MDFQTWLNILLGCLSAWLAYRNFTMSNRHDVQRESQEMTEIRVQLTQVMEMLRDLQKEVRISNADFRDLSKQVAIIEVNLNTAFKRIDELREYHRVQPPHEEK